MLLRLSKFLLVLTLISSIGFHWTILQSVAWVGMAVNYSRDASITEALSKTFDGRHPCKLCKFVQKGQTSEKKQDTQKPETKADKFLPTGSAFMLCPPELPPAIFGTPHHRDLRTESPPKPPPRGLSA